jgi:hypothetical protein
MVSGSVTLTAVPNGAGYTFSHWLVNGINGGSSTTLNIAEHARVQAFFYRLVTVNVLTDGTGAGTLRYALANIQNYDLIRFTGVTPGTTEIALGSVIPTITTAVNFIIEGNGITLTPGGGYPALNRLLYINNPAADVTIRGVHFKNGSATTTGAAIRTTGAVTLESCIFSGNTATTSGAVYTTHNLTVRGCTFYNNSSTTNGGAAIYFAATTANTLTLTGNMFYGNTATAISYSHVVRNLNNSTVVASYNAVDKPTDEGFDKAGWIFGTGDTTFATLGIGGAPINSTTFEPITDTGLNTLVPSLPGFPTTDFNGIARTVPGSPGAVK